MGPRVEPDAGARGFAIHRRPVAEISLALERRLGLIPDEPPPLAIAGARHALLRAVIEHLRGREGEWMVWMLDDDLRLAQLVRDAEGIHERRELALLAELRRLWLEHPELSIGLGSYCGDPPIPGFATWLGQLGDLRATLEAMASRGPDDRWIVGNARAEADDYYDHAGDRLNVRAPVMFEAEPGASVGEAFAALVRAWPGVLRGVQVTRPLLRTPAHGPRASIARGGNVAFFDRDALLAAPVPALRCEDGVITRRGDSLAALLARGGPWPCAAVDLPLTHGRRADDRSSPAAGRLDEREFVRFVEAQARGIALARALELGDPSRTAELLEQRRRLHSEGFAATRAAFAEAREALRDPAAWWWSGAFEAQARALLASLEQLGATIPSDAALAEHATAVGPELEAFARSLAERAEAWRRAWA